MKKLIIKYKNYSFEEKTLFSAKFSILFNASLAIGKIVLGLFHSIFFLVAGIINVLMMMSKLECYLGVKYHHLKTFKYRNIATGIFLMLAGIQYAIYMGRLIYSNVETMKYGGFLAVSIATVSFIEMGIAIYGCFKAYGKGHYYRNLKLINLSSAMTAIVLTEVALMSFASDTDSRVINGIFGLVVGLLIVLIGIFVIIAPKISIVDRIHNVYKIINNKYDLKDEFKITLTNSKIYGSYYYEATIKDNVIDGYIKKTKSPIFKWNIYIKILIIVLSEILIFPYAVGALISHFKNVNLIKKLDENMINLGCEKIIESEE